jgi:hypothetical protein
LAPRRKGISQRTPHFLINDVVSIDLSLSLFGNTLAQPFYLSVTGGKNCFVLNGEQETAIAAGKANTMMIASGGIRDVVRSGKGPKVWWQYATATEFRNKNQMAEFAGRLEEEGCSAISVTVDIYVVSHRERSMHNGLVRSWCQMRGVPAMKTASWCTVPMMCCGQRATCPRRGPFPHRPGTVFLSASRMSTAGAGATEGGEASTTCRPDPDRPAAQ